MNTALEAGVTRGCDERGEQSGEVLVWLAASAGQAYIQPCTMDREKRPHANEYRGTAISW